MTTGLTRDGAGVGIGAGVGPALESPSRQGHRLSELRRTWLMPPVALGLAVLFTSAVAGAPTLQAPGPLPTEAPAPGVLQLGAYVTVIDDINLPASHDSFESD